MVPGCDCHFPGGGKKLKRPWEYDIVAQAEETLAFYCGALRWQSVSVCYNTRFEPPYVLILTKHQFSPHSLKQRLCVKELTF